MGAALHSMLVPAASSGNFIVMPNIGLMIWTLVAFGGTYAVLRRFVFPKISEELGKRQRAIEDTIDTAERTRKEADQLLAEYRERLREAREQAEHIVARARKAAETTQREGLEKATQQREELMEDARRDIQAETRRALQEIRNEVADLTVLAAEKVTRKTLTDEDQRRLVEDAIGELDFSALAGEDRRN